MQRIRWCCPALLGALILLLPSEATQASLAVWQQHLLLRDACQTGRVGVVEQALWAA